MEKPRPRTIESPIDLRVDSKRLRERPDHCFAIVAILGAWNEIEDDLGLIFSIAAGAEEAVAASILRPVVAIRTKLDVVKRALALRFGKECAAEFAKASRRLSEAAKLRNQIAHGHWAVHDDFPESIIRLDGITDPLLGMQEWGREELLQAYRYLLHQQIALRRFEQELLAYPQPIPSAADQGRAWRLVRSHGLPDRMIPPAHTSRPIPEDPPRTTTQEPESPASADPTSEDPEGR